MKVRIATVVYYDGVEGYTTHRALFVNDDLSTMTTKSKRAIRKDFQQAGCEILKVDFSNGQFFDGAVDFMSNVDENSIYRCSTDFDEVNYIKEKFVEYFIG